jgi:hypothetical protein
MCLWTTERILFRRSEESPASSGREIVSDAANACEAKRMHCARAASFAVEDIQPP